LQGGKAKRFPPNVKLSPPRQASINGVSREVTHPDAYIFRRKAPQIYVCRVARSNPNLQIASFIKFLDSKRAPE
jgi:hypothetical protein